MNTKYFTVADDFKEIIESVVGKTEQLNQIATGWTNFVFDVKADGKEYIFRFPRNDFFSGVLQKEVAFCQFLKGKTTLQTTNINLHYNEGRPFTKHDKIKGRSLTVAYGDLTKENKEHIAKQVAEFIYELQHISLDGFNMELPTTSQFLADLSKVDNEYYDFSKHDNLIKLEDQEMVLNHADLNPGNILIDENNKACAVLDFAFVSKSSKINDVSRLIGRLPTDFHEIMLKAYNDKFGDNVTMQEINSLISVWNYVEEHYINYMRVNQPEIDIGR